MLIATLIACGGGSAGEVSDASPSPSQTLTNTSSSTQNNQGLLRTGCDSFSQILSSPDGLCSGSPSSSSSGSTSNNNTTTTYSVFIEQVDEFEPNNTAENANPINFPTRLDDSLVGIKITGTVHGSADTTDFFTFSPPSSKAFAVYLCLETCQDHPTDSLVAIQVLDQSLNLINGNPLEGESTKILTADLSEGLVYYLQLISIDTASADYPYELVIIE
ncbi:MAG TPA: hypothetical protein VLA24_08045 [Pseudomonadales bacterium]|nr:hypothetical protein [Pseudomonadales bacterium]